MAIWQYRMAQARNHYNIYAGSAKNSHIPRYNTSKYRWFAYDYIVSVSAGIYAHGVQTASHGTT